MEGFQIRRATLDDKQAVMDINNNVYNGFDYLKALYEDEFINSHNTKSFVAVYDGQIVGFAAGTVVDDGKTVISRAARVNKQYNNKGFYKMLKNHASDDSGATIDAFTTGDTNPAINSSSFQKQNRLISTVTFILFGLSPNDARLQTSAIDSPIKLNNLTQSLLQEYFETDVYRKYLFPKERIVIAWVPYRTLSSNIPLFWTRNEHCHRVSDVRKEGGVIRGLVTISSTYIASNGTLVCPFDIFGTDIESLKYHIASHFEFLKELNDLEISICVQSDIEMGYEQIEKVFGEFGLSKFLMNSFDSPSYQKAICLFERSLVGNE